MQGYKWGGISKAVYAGACHGNAPMVVRKWRRKSSH